MTMSLEDFYAMRNGTGQRLQSAQSNFQNLLHRMRRDFTKPLPPAGEEDRQAMMADVAESFRLAGEKMQDPFYAAMAMGPGQIKAFHGSPHRFSKFKMEKVGTGEGAQAFGHGLYFTDQPGIAQWYASRLGSRPQVKIGGKVMSLTDDTADSIAAARLSTRYKAHAMIHGESPSPKQIIELEKGAIDSALETAVKADDFPVFESLTQQRIALQRMEEGGVEFLEGGSFYEVALHKGKDPSQYKYADWYGRHSTKQPRSNL